MKLAGIGTNTFVRYTATTHRKDHAKTKHPKTMKKKPKNNGKPYTPQEDKWIAKHYATKTNAEIAKHLKRTKASIYHRLQYLQLIRKSRWSADETKRLSVLYGTMPIQDLAEKMGRPFKSVVQKINKLGLKADRKVCYDEKGRKVNRAGACKIYWSEADKANLRRLYANSTNTDIAEFFGISESTLYRKARELQLEKDPDFLVRSRKKGMRAMRLHNITQGNSGMIKPGEHRSPKTEFKKKQ